MLSSTKNAGATTTEQQDVLRRMLGLTHVSPRTTMYRDYYYANPGDAMIQSLRELGLVRLAYINEHGYEVYHTTDAGTAVARKRYKQIVQTELERRSFERSRWMAETISDEWWHEHTDGGK